MRLTWPGVLLLLSVPVYSGHTEARARAVVTRHPDWKQTFEEESVTLRCDIQGAVDTDWEYEWIRTRLEKPSIMGDQEYRIRKYSWSDRGDYTCRGKHKHNQTNSEWSAVLKLEFNDRPKPVLNVSPSWPNPGDSVTLSCEVGDASTGWSFSFYRAVPYTDGRPTLFDKSYSLDLLSDSNGTTGNYTLNSAGLTTGGYVCRGGRGETVYYTSYSNPQFLWSGDLNSLVSLSVSSNQSQHLISESLSLSCDLKGNSTGWKLKIFTDIVKPGCPTSHGSIEGSTCTIRSLETWFSGVYWCESGSGEFSNAVNITVHDGPVILESPVHPVAEGDSVTLHCKHRTPPSSPKVDFYKDGDLIRNDTTGEMSIPAVSKSDQGLYKCQYSDSESAESWLTVRAVPDPVSPLVVGLVVTGALIFIIILIILLIIIIRYRKVKDRVAGPSDVIYSQIELKNLGQPKRKTGRPRDNIVYSEVATRATSGGAAAGTDATYAKIHFKRQKAKKKKGPRRMEKRLTEQ